MNRLDRFNEICADIDRMMLLARKHGGALQKCYELDKGGVPFDDESRVYVVSDQEKSELLKAGFSKIYGLRVL